MAIIKRGKTVPVRNIFLPFSSTENPRIVRIHIVRSFLYCDLALSSKLAKTTLAGSLDLGNSYYLGLGNRPSYVMHILKYTVE